MRLFNFILFLPPAMKLSQAHDVTHDVEKKILSFLPKAHIIIHQDCELDQEDLTEKKILDGGKDDE